MSECPLGGTRCPESICDCFIDLDWPCRLCDEMSYFDGDGHAEHRDGPGSHKATR